jgi:hypothetical protein
MIKQTEQEVKRLKQMDLILRHKKLLCKVDVKITSCKQVPLANNQSPQHGIIWRGIANVHPLYEPGTSHVV